MVREFLKKVEVKKGFEKVMAMSAVASAKFARWAPVPLRLIVGYGFMAHGYAKLASGPGHFIGILGDLGVPAPEPMGWATIIIELLGGFAILIGAFVPLAAVPMAAILLTAIFTVHAKYGFSSIKLQAVTPTGAQFGQPGYETSLLYLVCLAVLVLGGSGPFSLDAWLGRIRTRELETEKAEGTKDGVRQS